MELYNEDCLEGMKRIPDGAVDMILTDLPYGGVITEFSWDKRLPFEPMWKQFKRVLKSRRAICLFGQEPFASELRLSAFDWYKYDWIWRKNRSTNILNCRFAPLRVSEHIMIFPDGTNSTCGNRQMIYNPQGIKPLGKPIKIPSKTICHWGRAKRKPATIEYVQGYTNYPQNILEFRTIQRPAHPTQKPVDLLEYLIRTYSNEGELVLDATMGSGSTGVAAVNTGRDFIGFETEKNFFDIACKRIADAQAKQAQNLFKDVAACSS